MIDLIVGLLEAFLATIVLLPCLVILAMLIRSITRIFQIDKPVGSKDRRARNLTEIAAMNTSLRSASWDGPCITRGEIARQLLSLTTPLYPTRTRE